MISASILWLAAGAGTALAETGAPQPWQVALQEPASKVMENIVWFNNFTLTIITVITIFVLGLLAACILKFRQSANPEPSRVTHNTMLEVAWTVIPIFILVVIAVPSFKLLYAQFDPSKIYEDFDPDTTKFLTVKAIGSQWYWDYEYAVGGDNEAYGVDGDVSFSSTMLGDDELGPDDPRLLAVDSELVVPVDTFVRVQVTAADVIHAFAVPSFGIKIDAVPGRLNETYFRADREGIYYGQCSELCGKDHAFMPIAVRVVSADQFSQWAAAAVDDVDAANEMLARLIDEDKTRKLASAE
jgi:cytochrome c oxidase subunit 2